MAYGQLLGALTITTLGRSAGRPRRSMPTQRRGGLASPTVAVCTALVIAVTLAVAAGFASSAMASRGVVGGGPTINGTDEAIAEPTHGPTINGTDEAIAEPTHGPTINGTDEATAEPMPKDPAADRDDTPWALAVIGTGLALGAIGLGISRRLNHSRTSPAAPSLSDT